VFKSERRDVMAWKLKGIAYEGCAAEGQCPLFFSRDMEAPCKFFMVLEIKEGQINNVDMKGIVVIYVSEFLSPKAADVFTLGAEGAVYVTDAATEEQRRILKPFVPTNLVGGMVMKKCLGVKFVKIDISQEDNTYHITMPHGELKLTLTAGLDGVNPVRLDNSILSMILTDIKVCNTHFWKYSDFGKNWGFVNRSGMISPWELQGE